MTADSRDETTAREPEWRGDFAAAEERTLEAFLAATPEERLQWLEEALAFAARMGALRAMK